MRSCLVLLVGPSKILIILFSSRQYQGRWLAELDHLSGLGSSKPA
jgi:hypothetical protein